MCVARERILKAYFKHFWMFTTWILTLFTLPMFLIPTAWLLIFFLLEYHTKLAINFATLPHCKKPQLTSWIFSSSFAYNYYELLQCWHFTFYFGLHRYLLLLSTANCNALNFHIAASAITCLGWAPATQRFQLDLQFHTAHHQPTKPTTTRTTTTTINAT